MSAKNTVEVLIAGKIMHLSGYESEDYLQKVAAYLNHKLGELHEIKGFSRMPADTKSMLLSLNISDDYFKAKKQAEVFEEDLQAKDKELYDLKHELVSLQVQIDKMKRAEDDAVKASYTAASPSPAASAAPAAAAAPVSSAPAGSVSGQGQQGSHSQGGQKGYGQQGHSQGSYRGDTNYGNKHQ